VPPNVVTALREFVAATRETFHGALRSVVVFGSAAEGRMRRLSNVNVIVVADAFEPAQLRQLSPVYAGLFSAVRLTSMMLRVTEIDAAASADPVKFDDIRARHRVIFGEDLLSSLVIDPHALRRALLNDLLESDIRLRERYLHEVGQPERLERVIVDVSSALRACAASLLRLRGEAPASPKLALEALTRGASAPVAGIAEDIARTRQGAVSSAQELLSISERLIHAAAWMRLNALADGGTPSRS
jgi:hypothetical protein